ncbi:hypothetical protein MP228_000140 [Amoeboaphelidium protococcarum]|nr:hypothetical protein MP228_000140 [Amoeboaphelidium protococcarum]
MFIYLLQCYYCLLDPSQLTKNIIKMSEQELRRSSRLRQIPRVDYNEHRLAKQQMQRQRMRQNQLLNDNNDSILLQQENQKEPVCDKQELSKVNDEKINGSQRSDAVLEPLVPVKQEQQQRDAPRQKQKRRKSRKNKGNSSERHQVWAVYNRMFPRLPENKRNLIYNWSFAKGSGRIGTVQHMPLDKRVLIAVRTHALYNMTDLKARYQEELNDLYRDEWYGNYQDEEDLYEEIKEQCDRQVDRIIAKWR